MSLRLVLKLALLASGSLRALAAPIADLGIERSPSLEHQLFPRGPECTCCLPASTIVLTSTKLALAKATETFYTTKTQTKAVNAKATTTVTPTVTIYSGVTLTTQAAASSTEICAQNLDDWLLGGDFDNAPDFYGWIGPSSPFTSYGYSTGNKGQGGSRGYRYFSCSNSPSDSNGCSDGIYQEVAICAGAVYTLSAYYAFMIGEPGDGTCRFVTYFNGDHLFTVHRTPENTKPEGQDVPWTLVDFAFVAPGDGYGRLHFNIECDGARWEMSDYILLDSLSLRRTDNAVLTETVTITYAPGPSTTIWETVPVPANTHTTYTLVGGTRFWKRDGQLMPRAPLVTLTDCPCSNVECMTAVASTLKTTITSTSTISITRPAETGIIIHVTATQWKTLTAKSTVTTTAPSTIFQTIDGTFTEEISLPVPSTTTVTTTVSLDPEDPITTTVTATADDITTTVTYTQVAYFPTNTMIINGFGDAPATDTWEQQTEEFSIDRCAQWCAEKPECYDWGIRSDNGWPFGTRNPPTRYCIWFGASNRFDEQNMSPFLTGGFPWVTDAAVWKRVG
ncbi:hypothetical protein ABW19_dt0205983 [Dactylella cylindrospora]|nr:hypothetical protein ABW19_dt0205983 [Dactylella cylindrospora]